MIQPDSFTAFTVLRLLFSRLPSVLAGQARPASPMLSSDQVYVDDVDAQLQAVELFYDVLLRSMSLVYRL